MFSVIIWLALGLINLISKQPISKFQYFICWLVLMAYLIANALD